MTRLEETGFDGYDFDPLYHVWGQQGVVGCSKVFLAYAGKYGLTPLMKAAVDRARQEAGA